MSLETESFQFGEFLLNGEERVFLRNGKPVPITPKTFLLLQTLVENHGHLVEKDKLMKAVWADSFVEDGNLTFTIGMVRKALGDDTQHPRFIETVPRRGYRFIAPVNQPGNGISPVGAAEQSLSNPVVMNADARKRPSGYFVSVLLVFILGILSTGIWYATNRNRNPDAAILSVPFNAEMLPTSGYSRHAVISPDGKYAAYTDETGGKQNIWLRQLEQSENIQIVPPSDDYYFGLAFSNSGDSLFFIRKPTAGHVLPALYRIATFGGIPVRILDNLTGPMSLSPNDKQISFVRCMFKKDDFCSLIVAESDGGNERKLLTTPNGVHISTSQFSPDGKNLAISTGRFDSDAADFTILEVNIETGTERAITKRKFFDIRSLRWLPNGTGLLFTSKEYKDGKSSIWLVSTSTGDAVPLTKDAGSYSNISLDRSGNKMIAVQPVSDFKINVSSGGETKTLGNARDLTFSNDGKIVYSTFNGEIWIASRDGSEQRQLTNNSFGEWSPRVSPDGRSIYFSSNESGTRHVWRMNSDGTNRVQLTTTVGGHPELVTADGRYIYYVSGSNEHLYKVSSKGGEETAVHDKKLIRPAISPDGSLIAYFFLDKEFMIAVMRAADKQIIKILKYGDGKSFAQQMAWSADNRTLNFILDSGSQNTLWQHSLDEEIPRQIANLGGEEIRSFAIAPSDSGFGFIRGKWNYDVVLVTGLH